MKPKAAPGQRAHRAAGVLARQQPFQAHVSSHALAIGCKKSPRRCRSSSSILCQAQDGKSAGADDFWRVSNVMGFSNNAAAGGIQAVSLAPQPSLPSLHGHGLGATFTPITAPGTPQPPTHMPGELSWQQWLSYFEQADTAAERKEQLALELKDAVRQENYSAAAQIKAEVSALEAQDAVSNIRRELDQALAQERYAEAAQLRDTGMSGLAGWWAGQAEDDPVGHLLHITPEYSRWTGRVFRPRDIAEMKVQKPDLFGRPTPRPLFGPAANKPSGSPVLEVFLRPDMGSGAGSKASQGFLHQAVSLRLPTLDQVEQRRMRGTQVPPPPPPPSPSFMVRTSNDQPLGGRAQTAWPRNVPPPPQPHMLPGSGTAAGPTSATVRLCVSILRDGTTRIAGSRPLQQPTDTQLSPWEPSASGNNTARLPPWSSPTPTPFSPAHGPTAGSAWYVPEPQAPAPQPEAASWQLPDYTTDDIIDISSQHAMSSLDAEDGGVLLPEPSGPIYGSQPYTPSSQSYNSMYPIDGLEDLYEELMRVPARIQMLGRDQMVYHVPEDPTSTSTIFGRPSPSTPNLTASPNLPLTWGTTGSVFGSLHGSSMYGSGSSVSSRGSGSAAIGYEGALQSGSMDGGDAQSEEGAASFEVLLPIASSGPQDSDGVGDYMSAPPIEAVAADTLNILADQVAQSMEARVGQSAPREEIAEALREVVRRVMWGESSSCIELLATGRADALSRPLPQPEPAAPPPKTTSIFYKRLQLEKQHTDPLNGLFLGSFGPHGPELLHLSRSTVEGEDMVHATKVTGDANVPAGLVSFRAKVGRKHKLDSRDVYPEELGISARFKGEGRVAQRGFTHPRWVEGELLVFGSKGNPLTAGAELGFVWAVPGEKRFLILLNRVDLS